MCQVYANIMGFRYRLWLPKTSISYVLPETSIPSILPETSIPSLTCQMPVTLEARIPGFFSKYHFQISLKLRYASLPARRATAAESRAPGREAGLPSGAVSLGVDAPEYVKEKGKTEAVVQRLVFKAALLGIAAPECVEEKGKRPQYGGGQPDPRKKIIVASPRWTLQANSLWGMAPCRKKGER